MVLIDSCVWIEHIRSPNDEVDTLLAEERALIHSYVLGEVALGRQAQQPALLQLLAKLPQAISARPSEVLALIRTGHLAGRGVGYVDVVLLASARLTRARFLTSDRRLNAAAIQLGLV